MKSKTILKIILTTILVVFFLGSLLFVQRSQAEQFHFLLVLNHFVLILV